MTEKMAEKPPSSEKAETSWITEQSSSSIELSSESDEENPKSSEFAATKHTSTTISSHQHIKKRVRVSYEGSKGAKAHDKSEVLDGTNLESYAEKLQNKPKKMSYDRTLRIEPSRELSKMDRQERLEFHSRFQMLVRASASGSKMREPESLRLIVPEASKNERSEQLWISLQAFWAGKPMKTANEIERSVAIHESWLESQRRSGLTVLEEIRRFKHRPLKKSLKKMPRAIEDDGVGLPSTPELTENLVDSGASVNFALPEEDEAAGESIESDSGNSSPSHVFTHGSDVEMFKDGFLERQRYAITEVGTLIAKFEGFQELFPTTKSMRRYLGSEFDSDLEERICVLYVWLNITQDLCMKIRDVGRMLGMEKIYKEAEDILEVVYDWPNLEFLPHPKKMSYATQCSLVPGDGTSVVSKKLQYKKFVEKSVRLRGMRKVLANLAALVEKSLRKAREALQRPISRKELEKEHRGSRSPKSPKPPQKRQHSPSLELLRRTGTQSMSITDFPAFPCVIEPRVELPLQHSDASEPDTSQRPALQRKDTTTDEGGYSFFATSFDPGTPLTPKKFPGEESPAKSPGKLEPFYGTKRQMSNLSVSSFRQLSMFKQFVSEEDTELTTFGVCSETFKKLDLPSFYPSFLFLLRIPLDLVHHWLHLRVEQKAITEPDPHTLETLIQDCRDCLEAAVEVKCFYHNYVRETTHDEQQLEKLLFKDLEDFEGDLVKMFQTYLGYVRGWFEVHSNADVKTRDWGQALLDKAQEEWKFAKKIAINIISGESDAARQFCNFGKLMLEQMVENYLVTSCDRQRTELFECSEEEEGSDSEEERAREDHRTFIKDSEEFFNDSVGTVENSKLSTVFLACKMFKDLIVEVRERGMRAMKFAKLLRADLEISAKFELTAPITEFIERLKNTGHVMITTVRSGDEFVLFCNNSAAANDAYVQLLLNVTCGRDANEMPQHVSFAPGYLLVVSAKNWDISQWRGPKLHIVIDADTEVALHYIQADAVYLVVVNSKSLKGETELFMDHMESGGTVHSAVYAAMAFAACTPAFAIETHNSPVKLVDPQCSCHVVVESNMDQLKQCALNVRQTISKILNIMRAQLRLEKEVEQLTHKEGHIYRDALVQGFNFAFEYQRELARLMNNQFKGNLAYGMASFVGEWRNFVEEACPSKKEGVAPRWAQEGLQFLSLALHPSFTIYLSNKDFEALKENVAACEVHIFGAGTEVIPIVPGQSGILGGVVIIGGQRSRTANPMLKSDRRVSSGFLWPSVNSVDDEKPTRSASMVDTTNMPKSVETEKKKIPVVYATEDPRSRIQNTIYNKEKEQETKLQSQGRIGHCISIEQVEPVVYFTGKKANFKWSRMEKMIGKGASGSVYKGYNMDAKKLMAVKQIRYERHDQGTMMALIDEISNFEKMNHPNLVKYYGVEAHLDELLIFMEYCDGGTLESVCREGLDPVLIRQYTHFLLRGINDIHEHLIVHRDIKPGNIFLTSSKEVLKLGDFGSSVRLRNSGGTCTGELTSNIGTPAYMAPEVITGGHQGRASDVWSLGCVVLEMATGKNPWHGLNNPNQILFKVGSGFAPTIPDGVSNLCRDFLDKCFPADPMERWTANQLIEHEFAKVGSMVDNLSQQ